MQGLKLFPFVVVGTLASGWTADGGGRLAVELVDELPEEGHECSRISPKEVFYTDVLPRLVKTLDEMSYFIDGVVGGLEEAMETLTPHVTDSPLGGLDGKQVFTEVRGVLHGTLQTVYQQVAGAWLHLITTSASPTDIQHLHDVQQRGEQLLVGALQELSITTKTIITNSIYVVQRSLHLPNNTPEATAAQRIHTRINKVAPNFVGRVMEKVLERGTDPSGYKKLLTNPLRDIISTTNHLQELVSSHSGDSRSFWGQAVDWTHKRMRDSPLLQEDLHIIYQNPVYLTELTLSLMATF